MFTLALAHSSLPLFEHSFDLEEKETSFFQQHFLSPELCATLLNWEVRMDAM